MSLARQSPPLDAHIPDGVGLGAGIGVGVGAGGVPPFIAAHFPTNVPAADFIRMLAMDVWQPLDK